MEILVRPPSAARCVEHPVDHRRRTADIKMRAERLMVEKLRHWQTLGGIIAIKRNASAVGRAKLAGKRGTRAVADTIVELEGAILGSKLLRHGDDWRNADAAGDEEMLAPAPVDRKEVDRSADREISARLD